MSPSPVKQDMKRALLLIPCLGLTAFGSYFHHWNAAYIARAEDIASYIPPP